ncbi:MAG: hypothetical protein ACI8QC_000663 [Planctomycetota bacterium]|jgi:hypothetical protein
MFARLALIIGIVSSPAQVSEYPTGPALDGAPGFGRSPNLRALEAIFHKPEPADQQFLAGLRDILVDVDSLLAQAQARARRTGLMRVVPQGIDSLQGLIDHVLRIRQDPFRWHFDGEQSLAFVRTISDWQLLAHGDLIVALEEERPMLIQSLDLLHGHAHGLVGLVAGEEAALVTGQADLAAARLRAVLADLEAMKRPLHAPSEPLTRAQSRVASGLSKGGSSARRSYRQLLDESFTELLLWREKSHLADFDHEAARQLGDRRRGRDAGREKVANMRSYLPIYDSYRELPEQYADMSGSERARLGVLEGTKALWADPLNKDLNFILALATDFASGPKAAEYLFDRSLVLAGIRHYDHLTYQYRRLSIAEQYALERIAGWLPTGEGR